MWSIFIYYSSNLYAVQYTHFTFGEKKKKSTSIGSVFLDNLTSGIYVFKSWLQHHSRFVHLYAVKKCKQSFLMVLYFTIYYFVYNSYITGQQHLNTGALYKTYFKDLMGNSQNKFLYLFLTNIRHTCMHWYGLKGCFTHITNIIHNIIYYIFFTLYIFPLMCCWPCS